MHCNNCEHLIAGTCEIYGDYLPEDSTFCEYRNRIEERTLEMEVVDIAADLSLIGLEEGEEEYLRTLEHLKGIK